MSAIGRKEKYADHLFYVLSQIDWDELSDIKKIPCKIKTELKELHESLNSILTQIDRIKINDKACPECALIMNGCCVA